MIKKCIFLLLTCFCGNLSADQDITGFWCTIDKKTKKTSSVIAVYPYEGKYYGRIIATCNKEGIVEETMYHPESRAPGIQGDPYYCGLDIVWDARPDSNHEKYKGHIVDPREGKTYNAKLWRDGKNLILRGELFIFGKNITWPPFNEENFTADFKKPDISTFVPNIPHTK